ncbi:RNA-directed DNA polymerase from mobile element jockey [Trichonephila clavipes]|nr:RNA-directed DNA polymerase from mobile element jockey [Trichonephila clavipes]
MTQAHFPPLPRNDDLHAFYRRRFPDCLQSPLHLPPAVPVAARRFLLISRPTLIPLRRRKALPERWSFKKDHITLVNRAAQPYCDDKIEEVESLVDDFFSTTSQHARPLTSPSEVRGIIKKLQNRKAAGPDQIQNIAFKYFTQNVLTHLTKLYNQCLIKNHFPTLWKQANVIMLAKPNQDRTYPQGYRPISLINATAKIFERIILTRIKSHCKAIDCIPRSNAASGRAIQRYTN